MMIVVFGYPFNKARVNIRPSKFGVSISTPGQGDGTREIAAQVAARRRRRCVIPGRGCRSAGRCRNVIRRLDRVQFQKYQLNGRAENGFSFPETEIRIGR
jgi:hypothetical protein